MTKFEVTINKSHIWKGGYPCPNPNCTSSERRLLSKVSKSRNYWRYVCWCGTELRIPKEKRKDETKSNTNKLLGS